MKILILLPLIILMACKKEYSCENCIGKPDKDTLQIPPPHPPVVINPKDTIYNDLIAHCSIYVADESKVRAIYPQMMTKENPGHYQIITTIKMNGRHQYDTTFNLKNYLPMEKFFKGDTIYYRNELRMRFDTSQYFQDTFLVY